MPAAVGRGLLAACAAGCLTAGCSAGPTPTAAATPEAAAGPPARWASDEHLARCGDPVPDPGVLDLVDVGLDPTPAGTTATFRLGRPLPRTSGVVELAIGVWSGAGLPERSVGVRMASGRVSGFRYDVATAHRRTLPAHVAVAGDAVTVRLPADAMAGLGRDWGWKAFADVDGTQVDDCVRD